MSTPPARKSWTYKQLIQTLDPLTENVAISKDGQFACVVDEETRRMKALFVKKDKQRYVRMELDKMVEFIAAKLAPHFDAKKYLTELLLLQTPPEEIAELSERLASPAASVKEHRDCYTLRIGGKKGRPFELVTIF